MPISKLDLMQMEQRLAKSRKQPVAKHGVDREKDLHADILAECKRRGWIAFHSRMDKRTSSTVGQPDFIILGSHKEPLGIAGVDYIEVPDIYLIECKRAKGKLTTEQLGLQLWAKKLGHTIHVVRSMQDFLNIIEQEVLP